MRNLGLKNTPKEMMEKTIKLLPEVLRWQAFFGFWEDTFPNRIELAKNRKLDSIVKRLNEIAPPGINRRYQEFIDGLKKAVECRGATTTEERAFLLKEFRFFYKPNFMHCPKGKEDEYRAMIEHAETFCLDSRNLRGALHLAWLKDTIDAVEAMRNEEREKLLKTFGLWETDEPTGEEKAAIIEGKKKNEIEKELRKDGAES